MLLQFFVWQMVQAWERLQAALLHLSLLKFWQISLPFLSFLW